MLRGRNRFQVRPFVEKPPGFPPGEDEKRVMEVQGSHRALFSRQRMPDGEGGRERGRGQEPSRFGASGEDFPSWTAVVVDLEGGSKERKVSFGSGPDGERKRKKEKPSVVISLSLEREEVATKGTQTDFRESEAQTSPWRHEIQGEGKLLEELLSLNWFTLEKNFPPGAKEVSLIERARQKLAWENVIEGLRGKGNKSRRKSLVQRLSANEAFSKEQKKEEESRERLEMSRQQMLEAWRAFEEKLMTRLQLSYCRRKMENLSKINYWNHQLARKIRKVKSARDRLPRKPDIIALHEDKASELYAPKLRDGENPSLGHEVIDIQCRFLKRFHGLEILEKHIAGILRPKLPNAALEPGRPKAKKLELSLRKFVGKGEGNRKGSGRLTPKADAAESTATGPKFLRSYSEQNLDQDS